MYNNTPKNELLDYIGNKCFLFVDDDCFQNTLPAISNAINEAISKATGIQARLFKVIVSNNLYKKASEGKVKNSPDILNYLRKLERYYGDILFYLDEPRKNLRKNIRQYPTIKFLICSQAPYFIMGLKKEFDKTSNCPVFFGTNIDSVYSYFFEKKIWQHKPVDSRKNQPIEHDELTENDMVYYSNGTTTRLGKKIRSGGEGTVYELSNGNVAKIIKNDKMTIGKAEKIIALSKLNMDSRQVARPLKVLYDRSNKVCGFEMYYFKDMYDLGSVIGGLRFMPGEIKNLRYSNLVTGCINALKIVSEFHSKNIVLGDIRDTNFLIDKRGTIYFIDVDGYQVGNCPCVVGVDDYQDPWILEKDYSQFLRSRNNDNYALGILLFQLLTLGGYPYQEVDGFDEKDCRAFGLFNYSTKTENTIRKITPGIQREMWNNFPIELKKAFLNQFKLTGYGFKTADRKSPRGWVKELERFLEYVKGNQYLNKRIGDMYGN